MAAIDFMTYLLRTLYQRRQREHRHLSCSLAVLVLALGMHQACAVDAYVDDHGVVLVLSILYLLYLLLCHVTECSQIASLKCLSQTDVWVCHICCNDLFSGHMHEGCLQQLLHELPCPDDLK